MASINRELNPFSMYSRFKMKKDIANNYIHHSKYDDNFYFADVDRRQISVVNYKLIDVESINTNGELVRYICDTEENVIYITEKYNLMITKKPKYKKESDKNQLLLSLGNYIENIRYSNFYAYNDDDYLYILTYNKIIIYDMVNRKLKEFNINMGDKRPIMMVGTKDIMYFYSKIETFEDIDIVSNGKKLRRRRQVVKSYHLDAFAINDIMDKDKITQEEYVRYPSGTFLDAEIHERDNYPTAMYLSPTGDLFVADSSKTIRILDLSFDTLFDTKRVLEPGLSNPNFNSEITKITDDDLYLYIGNEVGDMVIYAMNEDMNKEYYINDMYTTNIQYINMTRYYIYVGSNSRGISMYVKNLKPYIVDHSDTVDGYTEDGLFYINFKGILEHKDKKENIRYRLWLIGYKHKHLLQDWSDWHFPGLEVDNYISIPIESIGRYNLKLMVELQDTHEIKYCKGYRLDTLIAEEPIMYQNYISIMYHTVPIIDCKMHYVMGVWNQKTHQLEVFKEDIIDVLSTNGLDWNVSVDNQGRLITEPYKGYIYDNIHLDIPKDAPAEFIFAYTFSSKWEYWDLRYPENNEYFIYSEKDTYEMKMQSIEEGNISNEEKFHIMDVIKNSETIIELKSFVLISPDGNRWKVTIAENYRNSYELDESGNLILDENGEPIIKYEPLPSRGNIETCILDSEDKSEGVEVQRLTFRNDGSGSKVGIQAPDGTIWDFTITRKGNGRTEKNIEADEPYYFVSRTIYNRDTLADILRALSNPVTYRISSSFQDSHIFKGNYDRNGEFVINRDMMLEYTMQPEGLSEELFKAHSHYFNVYINGRKVFREDIDESQDRGSYSVRFKHEIDKEDYIYIPVLETPNKLGSFKIMCDSEGNLITLKSKIDQNVNRYGLLVQDDNECIWKIIIDNEGNISTKKVVDMPIEKTEAQRLNILSEYKPYYKNVWKNNLVSVKRPSYFFKLKVDTKGVIYTEKQGVYKPEPEPVIPILQQPTHYNVALYPRMWSINNTLVNRRYVSVSVKEMSIYHNLFTTDITVGYYDKFDNFVEISMDNTQDFYFNIIDKNNINLYCNRPNTENIIFSVKRNKKPEAYEIMIGSNEKLYAFRIDSEGKNYKEEEIYLADEITGKIWRIDVDSFGRLTTSDEYEELDENGNIVSKPYENVHLFEDKMVSFSEPSYLYDVFLAKETIYKTEDVVDYITSQPVLDENGDVVSKPILDNSGNPVIDREIEGDLKTSKFYMDYGDGGLQPVIYEEDPIEIELCHRNNKDSENKISSRVIENEAHENELYRGEFPMRFMSGNKSNNIGQYLWKDDVHVFIRFHHSEYYTRIDRSHYKLRQEGDIIYVQLKNYIFNIIGSEIVLTTRDVDRTITMDLAMNSGSNNKPYYYIPLIQYDQLGNMRTFYSDDISQFEVVVDGYTLAPNVDYCLVNYYLHSHMPSMILFEEPLKPNSKVEITFSENDVYHTIYIDNKDNDEYVKIKDNRHMFVSKTFTVICEGKKLDASQYDIVDRRTLRILYPKRKSIIVRFNHKKYHNMDKILQLLHNDQEFMEESERHLKAPSVFKDESYSGLDDPNKIGKIYLIEAYSDKCFNNYRNAIFDCNKNDPEMLDSAIDESILFSLDYINNDIIIDTNEGYHREDFTMLLPPPEPYKPVYPEINTPPVFINQPFITINESIFENGVYSKKGKLVVEMTVNDREEIYYTYERMIDGIEWEEIYPYESRQADKEISGDGSYLLANRTIYDTLILEEGSHTLKYRVSDGENEVESEEISLKTGSAAVVNPVFIRQPEVISNIYDKNVKISMSILDPAAKGLRLFVSIVEGLEYIGISPDLTYEEISYDSPSDGVYVIDKILEYGKYTLYIKAVDANNRYKNARPVYLDLKENKPIEIVESLSIGELNPDDLTGIFKLVLYNPNPDSGIFEFTTELDYKSITPIISASDDIYNITVDNIKPGDHHLTVKINDGFDIKTSSINFNMIDVYEKSIFTQQPRLIETNKHGDVVISYSVKEPNGYRLSHYIKCEIPSVYGNQILEYEVEPEFIDEVYTVKFNIGSEANKVNYCYIKVINEKGAVTTSEEVPESIIIMPNTTPDITSLNIININTETREVTFEYTVYNRDNDELVHSILIDKNEWLVIVPSYDGTKYKYSQYIPVEGKHILKVRIFDGSSYANREHVEFEL